MAIQHLLWLYSNIWPFFSFSFSFFILSSFLSFYLCSVSLLSGRIRFLEQSFGLFNSSQPIAFVLSDLIHWKTQTYTQTHTYITEMPSTNGPSFFSDAIPKHKNQKNEDCSYQSDTLEVFTSYGRLNTK